MHLFINALAASAGGGLTYIRNVLPLMASGSNLHVTITANSSIRDEFRRLPNISFVELEVPLARRFWFEQTALPDLIRKTGADVLLSTGNFALWRSPVPQVLLSRNSIYLCSDFYHDLLSRHEYRSWLDTHFRGFLARRSIKTADVTVAPSHAFAKDLELWSGKRVHMIYHGFDLEAFAQQADSLSPEIIRKLDTTEGSTKLLFVSHYNYYRNFETLIRALPVMRDHLPDRPVKLILTCDLASPQNHGGYSSRSAHELVQELGVSDMVVELGPVPYSQLHQLYSRADIYVTPAYTETFAHPLVEAMASGVPVVASDLAVHREICGDAALFFSKFSAEALADAVSRVVLMPNVAKAMREKGLQRSQAFSWTRHVDEIVELCRVTATGK